MSPVFHIRKLSLGIVAVIVRHRIFDQISRRIIAEPRRADLVFCLIECQLRYSSSQRSRRRPRRLRATICIAIILPCHVPSVGCSQVLGLRLLQPPQPIITVARGEGRPARD